ncbi:hypothetical protein AKJ16_DCAP08162 [Drosera capensis]
MHARFIGRRCVVDDRIGDFCLCCFDSVLGCIYLSCEACVGLVVMLGMAFVKKISCYQGKIPSNRCHYVQMAMARDRPMFAAGNGVRALIAALIPWHHLSMLLAESHVKSVVPDFLDPLVL